MPKIAIVVLAHSDEQSLEDFAKNVAEFCQGCSLFLYNSGYNPNFGSGIGLARIPNPRPLTYAHIIPFFLDIFEWFVTDARQFEYLVNAETDMLFIRQGFEFFLNRAMNACSYMAANFRRGIPESSRWRPYHSLRLELKHWKRVLGMDSLNRAFNPGQVVDRRYVEGLLQHKHYSELRRLVDMNNSFTLHEVLNPSIVDLLGVKGRSYPEGLEQINRYRPYQAVSGVRRALSIENAYFVHPVRRDPNDPARRMILSLGSPRFGGHL